MDLYYNQILHLAIIGFFFIAMLSILYITTLYLRKKIAYSNGYILNTLVFIEYVLIAYLIYSIYILPYQLRNNSPFLRELSISRVMFNPIIYIILFVLLFLISLSTFGTITKTVVQRAKILTGYTILTLLTTFILFQVNEYFFAIPSINEITGLKYFRETKEQQLNEIFICAIPSFIWLYLLSHFKNNQTTIYKRYLYNYFPVLLWYIIFIIIILKPYLITLEEQEKLLEKLGAFG
jgi:hypothetical protein